MSQIHIAIIVGSLRQESFNQKLATALIGMAPDDATFTQIQIGDLPLYNEDDDADPSTSVKRLKGEILASHGIIFITPEYNRSISGVLKNAIDHASRPYGQSAWAGKPAGILGVSVGATGTAIAQQHLRPILAYLDMPTLGQPEVFIQDKPGLFGADGKIGEESRDFIQSWMKHYLAWVRKHIA